MLLTDIIIALFLAAIAGVDVVLMWSRHPTFSARFRKGGRELAFFPYAWGALSGHFWGPALSWHPHWWLTIGGLCAIGAIVVGLHRLSLSFVSEAAARWSWIGYLVLGGGAGAMLWSQG